MNPIIDDPQDPGNAIDLSLEAAIELEELKQRVRSDAPTLRTLFDLIRTPPFAFRGESLSMLEDARAYPLLRDTVYANRKPISGDFKVFLENYLNELEEGVSAKNAEKIAEAKIFCLSLNKLAVAKDMSEFYSRRDRQDGRNIFDEPLS